MAFDDSPPLLEAASAVRELAAGELLFRQGAPAAAIYKVESGRLRLIRRTVDDHLVILHTARRGEFFTEAALFAETVNAGVKTHRRAGVKMHHGTSARIAGRFTRRRGRGYLSFLVRSKSLLSRPDLGTSGHGAQRRGWEERSHAHPGRDPGEHGEHRTFPAASTVAG
jgi:CRP-like cAMP-binding protein